MLAFENANKDGQTIIHCIKEKEDAMVFLQACRNVGQIEQKSHVNI